MFSKKHQKCAVIALASAVVILIISLNIRNYYAASVDMAIACGADACYGKVILIQGEITDLSVFRVTKGLKEKVQQHPDIKTVCIASKGGATSGAMDIADVIHDFGLNTCLASRYVSIKDSSFIAKGLCQSSCTWMTLAGRERILYDDKIKLGFHAARSHFGNIDKDELHSLVRKIEAYVSNRSGSSDELEKLSLLSWWAFQQGATSKTTDCTAHELQSKYPYFTVVQSWGAAPAHSCGLKESKDVEKILE